MALLQPEEQQPSRARFWIVNGALLLVALAVAGWYIFRFQTEKNTVNAFLRTVAAGQLEQAYKLWKPGPAYNYNDFLADWGDNSFYGPVKSFRITKAHQPGRSSSGVEIEAELSSQPQFPQSGDTQNLVKTVRLWVQRDTQAISFAP